jgi:molybdate transport system substrate-binding protein
MKRWSVWLLICSIWVVAGEVRVATAANMGYALPRIIDAFRVHYPDVRIEMAVGGSGKLRTQIEHGAPYDLFLSANTAYPEALYAKGLGAKAPVVYARGELVLFSREGWDLSEGLGLLAQSRVKKIAMANPETAPYGKAAKEALNHAGLYEKVASKIVYGESISQTVAHTVSAADVGFVASSSLYAPQMAQYREGKQWIVVDPSLYTPIDQGMVILSSAKANAEVKAWYDYMLSPEAGKILQQYGYTLP